MRKPGLALTKTASAPHAVMFHHFHGAGHPNGQGALARSELETMLDELMASHNVLDAREFAARLRNGEIEPNDVCLSFDDGLLCQYDIALPVLSERGVRAFFFVYSSIFSADPDPLEVYRFFRTVAFSSMDAFHAEFFDFAYRLYPVARERERRDFDPTTYLAEFPFYSEDDRRFRYLRDHPLAGSAYHHVMTVLMSQHGFDSAGVAEQVWMRAEQVAHLHDQGHVVGLHSHTHPTMMHTLSQYDQQREYETNLVHLREIIGEQPWAMSHPCGHYDDRTLAVLQDLGVELGFRSNMSVAEVRSHLEVPREDHANVQNWIRS